MNRKQFVMGILSAAATSMIVTKEDVALAQEVRKPDFQGDVFHADDEPHGVEVFSHNGHIISTVHNRKTDNGWDEYITYYEKGIIESIYYKPAVGKIHSRLIVDQWYDDMCVYNFGTLDLVVTSMIDRRNIGFAFESRRRLGHPWYGRLWPIVASWRAR